MAVLIGLIGFSHVLADLLLEAKRTEEFVPVQFARLRMFAFETVPEIGEATRAGIIRFLHGDKGAAVWTPPALAAHRCAATAPAIESHETPPFNPTLKVNRDVKFRICPQGLWKFLIA
ncbi:hypothetical protein WNY37_17195 [Henriciella sp. AS95]|uniref:hypothetical protein n=1 Tax=Henriciella sp. AS95 TaxID=3135782 RepID=UPI0031808977